MRLRSTRGIRLACWALSLLLCRGLVAHAQQDTVRRSPSAAGVAIDTAAVPRTAHDAEAAGMKLLGVYDNSDGHWIGGATIRDTLGNEAVTSRIGVAVLNSLTPIAGYYLLEIRKPGYSPRFLRLRHDTTSEILAALAPNPLGGVLLAPTIVTAEERLATDNGQWQGFIARCGTGLISCVGRSVLDRRATGNLDNIVDHVDGIQRVCYQQSKPTFNSTPVQAPIGPTRAPGSCEVMMHSVLGGECTPNYVVNGFDWAPLGGDAQAELDEFLNPANIDGIEVYLPGHPVPSRFDPLPFSYCGVIVIWTR